MPQKPVRVFLIRKNIALAAGALLAAVAIFCAVNVPAAITAAGSARQLPIYCVDRSGEDGKKYCSISFDAAWGNEDTQMLIDILAKYDVKATFFLVGSRIEGREDLVRRIRQEGHQIGNHSVGHGDLTDLSAAQALADLDKCSRALEQVLGPGSYWLRPPYGFISQEELCALGTPAICWSVDTEDWKSRNVDSILDIVLRQAGDGDILLLHDCYPTSVTAALEIVDRLQPRGVQFVTVEELFAVKGVQPACGTLYRRVLGE